MSDLRVALIAEGPTDAVIIGAALKALLPRPFVLTQLQPEATKPGFGTGWGGVLRWCREFAGHGCAMFEVDPTMPTFDLFILHVDADVADADYADVSQSMDAFASQHGYPNLPNRVPCPPPEDSADVMRGCLLSWTGLSTFGPRTALCIPSKAIDAWLAAAVLDAGHKLLPGLECNYSIEVQLGQLPKAERIRKHRRDYLAHEGQVTESWGTVRQLCRQANRFSAEVEAVPI